MVSWTGSSAIVAKRKTKHPRNKVAITAPRDEPLPLRIVSDRICHWKSLIEIVDELGSAGIP
jgi:hypothetical protein